MEGELICPRSKVKPTFILMSSLGATPVILIKVQHPTVNSKFMISKILMVAVYKQQFYFNANVVWIVLCLSEEISYMKTERMCCFSLWINNRSGNQAPHVCGRFVTLPAELMVLWGGCASRTKTLCSEGPFPLGVPPPCVEGTDLHIQHSKEKRIPPFHFSKPYMF